MWILLIILIIVFLYIILIIAPSVVAYHAVFCRKTTTPLNERKSLSYYEPFIDRINSSTEYLSKLKKTTVWAEGDDGVKLCADLYDGSLNKTAICLHGYASGPDYNFAVQGEFLHRQGFNLLFINQRAHDRSGGKNICFGLKEQYDLINWVKKVKELTGNEQILIYGISMGCATAAYASDKLDENIVRTIIMDCGFTSPYDQLKHDYKLRHVPWRQMLPIARFLAKVKQQIDIKKPVSDSLSKTVIPMFFIHGTDDYTVPIEQGHQNFDKCSSEKQFYEVKDGKHTVSFLAGGEDIQKQLLSFLSKYYK